MSSKSDINSLGINIATPSNGIRITIREKDFSLPFICPAFMIGRDRMRFLKHSNAKMACFKSAKDCIPFDLIP